MTLPIILCKSDIAPNTQPRCGFGAIPFLPRISFYLTKYNIVYMPDGYDAVQINTTFVAPTATLEQYGTPLIIGTSASVDADKDTAKTVIENPVLWNGIKNPYLYYQHI